MSTDATLPNFFRVRQKFSRPCVASIDAAVQRAVEHAGLSRTIKTGQSVAITVGSRGIANIAAITKQLVSQVKALGGRPFIVPAMGSHGGGTAQGQLRVLENYGVTSDSMGCEIRSSMDTAVVCQAKEGFPVHFDTHAFAADQVIVVNRIKPHTRFFGSVESGLMKMMLIGLGKHAGAIVYHRVIQNYTFDQIVRSVAREVIARCHIAGGIAILENGYEETADIVGLPPERIETEEPNLLNRVRDLLPRLPFDSAELLILDAIGKNFSGSGMDTNIVGRKHNNRSAIGDERPEIEHIYVRSLSEETEGNAAGIGIAELCHRRVIEQMDPVKTRINCITAGHIAAAMVPVDFPNDRTAIETAMGLSGWGRNEDYPAMWIPNTLHVEEVECSQVLLQKAKDHATLEIIAEPRPLQFDSDSNLVDMF
ncbi:MAG: lactate racemase domain-containing protein [Pirellulaceae bacterium]|nr:lactate racemase domain-containing protein [Pirellulaceae bacterium]